MKLKSNPETGILSVIVDTPKGRRGISTGCTDLKEAREVVKAANIESLEVLAKAGNLSRDIIRKLVVGSNITVEQAISQWAEWLNDAVNSDRTAQNHTMYVNAWASHARAFKKPLTDITEGDISAWINAKDGAKLASRRVRLAAVRSLFKFCSIRQYIAYDPSRTVRVKGKLLSHEQKEPRKKTCFTEQEVERIVANLEGRINELTKKDYPNPDKLNAARFWYCATLIGRYAGLRLGDICSMEWTCMNKPGKLVVWTDKHDSRVELPIDKNLARGLDAIPFNTRKLCFPEQDAVMRNPKLRSKLSVQFGRILKDCGIVGHSFHDLRHQFLTGVVKSGKSLSEAAKMAGHASTRTTEGYVH